MTVNDVTMAATTDAVFIFQQGIKDKGLPCLVLSSHALGLSVHQAQLFQMHPHSIR